jgi:hypothetical protein
MQKTCNDGTDDREPHESDVLAAANKGTSRKEQQKVNDDTRVRYQFQRPQREKVNRNSAAIPRAEQRQSRKRKQEMPIAMMPSTFHNFVYSLREHRVKSFPPDHILFSNNLDPSTVSRFACLITRKVCQ